MSRITRRVALFLPALVLALVFGSAGVAGAACPEQISIEEAIAQAETVFVGTVAELQYGNRVATFQVEDIWKGDVVGSAVVNGAGVSMSELEAGLEVITDVERTYSPGEQYLVVSYGRDGDAFIDSGCSLTQPYTTGLAQYRPGAAHAPVSADVSVAPTVPAGDDEGSSVWAWIVVAALAVGVVGTATELVRRRRR